MDTEPTKPLADLTDQELVNRYILLASSSYTEQSEVDAVSAELRRRDIRPSNSHDLLMEALKANLPTITTNIMRDATTPFFAVWVKLTPMGEMLVESRFSKDNLEEGLDEEKLRALAGRMVDAVRAAIVSDVGEDAVQVLKDNRAAPAEWPDIIGGGGEGVH